MMRTAASWFVVLGILGVFAALLANATRPVTGPMRFDDSGSAASIDAPYFREFGYDGLRIVAHSERAVFDQLDGMLRAENVHGFVLRDTKRTEIWAKNGSYSMASTTAELTGDVRILNEDGYTFQTETAVYHHALRLLSAAGDFTAEGNGLSLIGQGLHFDLEADTFRVDSNVGASIRRFSF